MKALKVAGLTVVALAVAFFLSGCSREVLDYRNATVENGKIYSGDENKPFSGKVTNVPELDLLQSQEGFQQFLRPIIRSNDTLNHYRERPGVTAMLALSKAYCDVEVVEGYLEGTASCAGPNAPGPGTEMSFDGGTLTGDMRYYNLAYAKTLISEATFKDGMPEGKQEIYGLRTGKLAMTVEWKEGGLNGAVEKFDEDTGKRIFLGNYVEGQFNGAAKKFSPTSGQVVDTATYKAGKLDGPEDQYAADSGAHLVHAIWLDGYLHGRVKKWDASGKLVSDEMYRYGQKLEEQPTASERPASDVERALQGSATPGAGGDLSECQNSWISAYRSQAGEAAPVTADQLSEWGAWCSDGRLPSISQ